MPNNLVTYKGVSVPKIFGAGGGKGGGGKVAPNSLFSTDILFVTNALGEGPVYRINPNGPQDVQIQDNTIDDLINLDGDGGTDVSKLVIASTPGIASQAPLPFFGDKIVTPQLFGSPVSLKKGNLGGIPPSGVTLQETSANDWDAIQFNFIIDSLINADKKGNINPYSLSVRITLYNRLGDKVISTFDRVVSGKSDTSFKVSFLVNIGYGSRSPDGYRFTVEKTSNENKDPKKQDSIKLIGWDEIKNLPQAYPRTALIGYGIKAIDEHTGGVPNFTNLVKGLLVKVPSNYNQPILSDGQIDWRELEIGLSAEPTLSLSFSDGDNSFADPVENKFDYTNTGYKLQDTGPDTILYDPYPVIYKGTWDGTFVYSWTQNPVWILYDLLTNRTYGLGIAEENIDRFKFYQTAQYCDACDSITGRFIGVRGVSDGSFRYKPNGYYTSVRENQIGIPKGYPINERRFITDISIVDQQKALDVLNKIAATFRAVLVYSGGKISLAVDMPEEYPVMLFNDANIKTGSLQLSGTKESDMYTGVDVTYIEPTNHFKREVIRIDAEDYNRGFDYTSIENILSLDLPGVTRRSQAIRTAQYQIASSKYLKRNISFTTNTDALNLSPGDVISVATTSSGVAYGYGGKVISDSSLESTSVVLEHFTVPPISDSTFTNNTYPIALRILKPDTDKVEMYMLSNVSYNLYSTGNVSSGTDIAEVFVIGRFDPRTKSLVPITNFTSNIAPKIGDLWSIGEISNPDNYFSSESGKLFKVTGIAREPEPEDITVTAIEYISNVYVDSDTFINYEPTAYTGITSPFSTPPTPEFTFTSVPRTKLDGTVVIDGKISAKTEILDYEQKITTEYFIGKPDSVLTVDKIHSTNPLVLQVNNVIEASEDGYSAVLQGKNGFSSYVGEIRLLCTDYSVADLEFIELSVSGLSDCYDFNLGTHVLEANDGELYNNLKGIDKVVLPVIEKENTEGLLNFVGYQPQVVSLSREITSYDISTNKIRVENVVTEESALYDVLPNPPFYVTINQTLAKDYYSNNIFYVQGSENTFLLENSIPSSTSELHIELPVVPRTKGCISLYIDGINKTVGQFSLNKNEGLEIPANVVYQTVPGDSTYTVSVYHYSAPNIEIGDNVEVSYGNTFSVVATSYSETSPIYNSSATANHVYYIQTASSPSFDLSSYKFKNVTLNPVGTISQIEGNMVTLDYDSLRFPGLFETANNKNYSLHLNSSFESLYFSDDSIIPELSEGTTVVRARNKNRLGRVSAFSEKSVTVKPLPIQKVTNLSVSESLYKEQTGGVSVRVTVEFDHIEGQEVTDYEISYRLSGVDDIGIDDAGAGLTYFNTVKVSAQGVEADGKIRFTINNINRGETSETTDIIVRVTPLNRALRGITATASLAIVGKSAPPQNIYNFTGGQQTDQITLFWAYRRVNEQLADLDLKEIVIRRLEGVHEATLENFFAATDLVTVSAGSARKSIPIDIFGTYTYLARTRDTSGNLSEDVAATTIVTTKPQRTTVVASFSEDDPSLIFSPIPNNNSAENRFPSFADSTGGLSYLGSSAVDSANGSSSGWSIVPEDLTDLLADSSAEYITQIRSFDTTIIGQISIDAVVEQQVQTTFNDQHEEYLESVSDGSAQSNILVDADFGGIGHVLGFANASVSSPRYDANNRTWMTGGASGNVWGIWNHGQFVGDTANANSYALIAGIVDADTIVLGESFYANGDPTGSNAFSNITLQPSTYTLVNFIQYNDTGPTNTFQGDLGATSTQLYVRTSTSDDIYYANGNVDITAFGGSSTSDGFVPYEAGTKVFKHFQLKLVLTNNKPDEFDVRLDKFRYTVDKEQTIYSNTIAYTSNPTTVDYRSANYFYRPVLSYTVLDQVDPINKASVVVTTAASNQEASFSLVASDGSGPYPADGTATIMITAVGV